MGNERGKEQEYVDREDMPSIQERSGYTVPTSEASKSREELNLHKMSAGESVLRRTRASG